MQGRQGMGPSQSAAEPPGGEAAPSRRAADEPAELGRGCIRRRQLAGHIDHDPEHRAAVRIHEPALRPEERKLKSYIQGRRARSFYRRRARISTRIALFQQTQLRAAHWNCEKSAQV